MFKKLFKRQTQEDSDKTYFEQIEDKYNYAKYFLGGPIKFVLSPIMKVLKVSQAKRLTDKQKDQIRKEGITVLALFGTRKDLERYFSGGSKRNPQYTVTPEKKSFMAFVRGAFNGFMPSFSLFIGKTLSLEVLKLNKDILNHKKISSKTYSLHLSGDQVTDEILNSLRIKETDGILYSRKPITFTEIVKLEKRDMFRKRGSLKLFQGYGKWIFRMFVALLIWAIFSSAVSYVKEEYSPYFNRIKDTAYEEASSHFLK